MSKKILQSVVILLGILIIFSFIALIYGMYSKILKDSKDIALDPKKITLNLWKTGCLPNKVYSRLKNTLVFMKFKLFMAI